MYVAIIVTMLCIECDINAIKVYMQFYHKSGELCGFIVWLKGIYRAAYASYYV